MIDQLAIIGVETFALLIAFGALIGQHLRGTSNRQSLVEYRAAFAFFSHQVSPVGSRFLRQWSKGDLHLHDPILNGEWQQFRQDFIATDQGDD